jgi:gliding motility-associated-like protein
VKIDKPTVSDNCSTTALTTDGVRSDGFAITDPYPVGQTTITWTARDANGNVSLPCPQTITVHDVESPTIVCPPEVSVYSDAGSPGATNIALGSPATTDNCKVDHVDNDYKTFYPIGVHEVTWTVYDPLGHTNTCVQKLIVKDLLNPISAVVVGAGSYGECNPVDLDGSKSLGTGLTYKWEMLDPGGILSSEDTDKTQLTLGSSFPGFLPITIRVQLTVTDKYGIPDKAIANVTFNSAAKAEVSFPAIPTNDETLVVDGSASTGDGLIFEWTTTTGKIISDPSQPKVTIQGLGSYSLKVTDIYNCISVLDFDYPFESHMLIANPDYVRTPWVPSVDISVLNNDYDSKRDLDKSTLTIVGQPTLGTLLVNLNGSVTYTPDGKNPVSDSFVYRICDFAGLCDTAKVTITITEGLVFVPEGFSPDGDGINELFIIQGLEGYPMSTLSIYTRSGQLIYESQDYQNDWGGRALHSIIKDGTLLPTGTYYYVLHLGGTSRYIKGFVYIKY